MSFILIVRYTFQWLVAYMIAEKKFSSKISDLPSFMISVKNEKASSSGRVDINILLNRARKVKEKETTTNLIFVGLTLSLIFVVGIILSF